MRNKYMPWNDNEILKLKELFGSGVKNSDIANTLRRPYSQVCKKCRELGLQSYQSRLMTDQYEAKSRGVIICRKCKEEKSPEFFSLRNEKRYYKCVCKECEAQLALERYHIKKRCYSLEETLHHRAYQAKRRSCKKGLEYNITDADLVELYKSQNGKCFYSGITMEITPKTNNYYNISIDRIDSSKGYTKDNVVLCCDSINTMKNSMPKEVFLSVCEKIVSHQIRQV